VRGGRPCVRWLTGHPLAGLPACRRTGGSGVLSPASARLMLMTGWAALGMDRWVGGGSCAHVEYCNEQ
jgi:hypothetical protein